MSKIRNALILFKQYFWEIYFMIKSIPPFPNQKPFLSMSILDLIYSSIVVRITNNVKYIFIYCKGGVVTIPYSFDVVSILAQYAIVSEEIGSPPGLVKLKELEESIVLGEIRKKNQNSVEYDKNIKFKLK